MSTSYTYTASQMTAMQAAYNNAIAAYNSGDYAAANAAAVQYYQAQVTGDPASNRGYAQAAIDVINNVGGGTVANINVQNAIGAYTDQSKSQISIELMKSDYNQITSNQNQMPTEAQVADEHLSVFNELGIPIDNWGGTPFETVGEDYIKAAGYTANPAELQNMQSAYFNGLSASDAADAYENLFLAGLEAFLHKDLSFKDLLYGYGSMAEIDFEIHLKYGFSLLDKYGFILEWGETYSIPDDIYFKYNKFVAFPQRSDPFTLDFDGDGLETVGTNSTNPILFDIDATGIKQSVGWVLPDDGFLALDRNGNGKIDSGAELFGDATTLPDGSKAEDGFAAVASLDTNGDGVVDANDDQWTDLRVWQDLNQDGISQANELKTMAEAGIASINVSKTEHEAVLDNGNALADLGSFTRTDGSEGTTGTVGQLADVDLSVDTFHSEFTDTIPLTAEAEALPDMSGSGQVRDLQQAASMDTDAGRALASILAQYSEATTRDEQLALLDQLVKAWSDTSTMATTFTGAYAGHDLTVDMQAWFGGAGFNEGGADYEKWADILTIMERFNGRTYQPVPAGTDPVTVTLWHTPRDLLGESYEALTQSVYDGLLLQTRLDPYIHAINPTSDASGALKLDFSDVDATFQSVFESDPTKAVQDELDLFRISGTGLQAQGWDGLAQLRDWVAADANLALVASEMGYTLIVGADGTTSLTGTSANELILGGNGNDVLTGGGGADTLYGGAGSNTYVFNVGDGNDTIIETHGDTNTDTLQFGVGIASGDVTISVADDDLVFSNINGRDSVTVSNWFNSSNDAAHRLDTVTFADGSSFDLSHLQIGTDDADTLVGTADGNATQDVLIGGAGDDVLTGNDGDDWLDGGTGADQMAGGTGDDVYVVDDADDVITENAGEGIDTEEASISATLVDNVENLTLVGSANLTGTGSASDNILAGNSGDNFLYGLDGNDTLIGNAGNDTLDGGTGADQMIGGTGNDTYIVDAAGDTVIELANQGTDTVKSSIDYVLSDNVENLILADAVISGTGNALNNVLTGNAQDNVLQGMGGDDTLDGGTGADQMSGGTGNDTYIVDDVGDLVVENTGEGTDTVRSSIDYTLGDNVENLVLTGSTALTGTGNALNNAISGNDVANVLDGLAGNDMIYGYGGNDTLQGGAGNDTLDGGTGSDVYLFDAGDGQDTINNYDAGTGRVDVLQLGEGILPADVTARRLNDNLILTFAGSTDQITVSNYFNSDAAGAYRLDAIQFANGAVWDVAQIKALVVTPTDGDDHLYGYATSDTLSGLAGNDTIYGYGGNDTLQGGAGNDTLDGGAGSDVYLFDAGDGQDTISNYDASTGRVDALQLGESILPADVTARRLNNNLILTFAGSTDKITVNNYFAGDAAGNYQIDQIRFSDANSSVWSVADVKSKVLESTSGDDTLQGYASDDTILGGDGNDTISGNGGNDTLEGGTGNDSLNGGSGSDTYVFNTGDGQDTISNYDASSGRVDALQFGAGIDPADVTAHRVGNNLILAFATGDDQITISNYFIGDAAGNYQIDEIRFSDASSTVWSVADVKLKVLGPTSGDDTLQGYESDDAILGGDGNDTISGNGGNDILQGQAGNDSLQGGSGDDTLEGGIGNDTLDGGLGSDTYVFNTGDGQDTISNYDASSGRVDALQFGAGIDPADVTVRRVNNNLVLTFATGDDQITVNNYFVGDAAGNYQIDEVRFSDTGNTVWSVADVKLKVLEPTSSDDTLQGYASDDTILGGDGNDTISGNGGNDTLQGQAGADNLQGGDGDDVLEGGVGNDTLNGGSGSDTYVFNTGDGQDTISNYDASSGRVDALQFAAGIDPADVTARRVNNNLVITFAAGDDQITVNNYFVGDAAGNYQIDEIRFSDTGNTVWSVADVKLKVLEPTSSDDTLQGYASDDTILGGDGNDTISGNGGNDILRGQAGNDSLQGGSGDDTLEGGIGNDTLDGGLGSDTYVFNTGDGQDTISNYDASSGRVDALQFGAGIDPADVTVRRVNNNLVLTFATGDDQITVNNYFVGDAAGNYQIDEVRFSDASNTVWSVADVKLKVLEPTNGADNLQGYATDDTFAGGDGNDTLYGNGGNDTLSGDAGNDLIHGGDGNDIVTGGAGTDTLYGDAGNDQLDGGADNDTLYGDTGDDDLTGGLGNDQLEGGDGDDHYHFAAGDGQDTINDTQGLNTINLSGLPLEDVYLRREGTALVLHFANSSDDQIRLLGFFDSSTELALQGLVVDAGDGTPWTLDAAAIDAAALLGTSLDDVIDGNTLDNTINGLAGNDTLRGSAGADSLDGGAGDDALYGQAGNDVLIGGDGNDLLDGGAGADQLTGGAGDDTYVVDDAGDVVTEVADAGLDVVQSGVSFVLPDNVEQLTLTDGADIDGTGNALDNTLTGNSGNNHLQGLAGNDVLIGNGGDDTLEGGAGNDQLDGGDGTDTLNGGTGNDLLDGGAGLDQLTGGAGDDTYRVDEADDVIVELAGEGTDVVESTAYSYALSANIENLTLVEGSSAYEGIGNALDNVLTGNDNGNRLDGGEGADTLVGGLGDDTYVVDQTGDVIVENADEGNDTVESSITYTLGSALENLTLTGAANIDATGNAADNVIQGNAGNNRIDGGDGADTLYGGAGDDYYVAVSASDSVHENADEGIDTVERVFETNLVLDDNVENLILGAGITTGNGNDLDNTITGNAANNTLGGWDGDDTLYGQDGDDNLFGVNGADTLYGGAGNDYLDGGAGVDHMEGGTGDDNYIVDDSDDVVIEAANAGTDQVQTSASYTLTANVENLFLTGSAAINGTGNDLDNYIAGNGAANVINGGAGNDTIVAGGGDDTLIGGTGDDKYVFDADSGSDVIDNSDGGFDGVFFNNGITADDLTFTRDGDDLLIFVNGGSTPAVRVQNHFLGGDAAIDYVQPDGGNYLTTAQINQIVAGGSTGGEYDQVVEGTSAGEQLTGSTGKDLIEGLAGDDQLFGMGGNDTLQGGEGDDYLAGGNGSGSGSGDDRLEGGAGADTLSGEDGVNTLIGGAGDDSYLYGGGQDTIDNTGGGYDGVFFNDNEAADLTFARDGNDLVITVAGNTTGFVRVTGHFLGGDSALDFVQPANGSLLDTAAINALADPDGGGSTPGEGGNEGDDSDYPNVVNGTSAGEQLLGTSGRDLIHGLEGDDTLFGFGGDDKLVGDDGDDYLSGGNGSFSGSGNDILIGGAGADTLVGEDGDDTLIGGAGDDTYYYAEGSGADTVDNTGGGTDWLYFSDIDSSRLGFHQDGNDLVVTVDNDLSQSIRVLNHFLGGDAAISYVQPNGGYAISASQIPSLLTPMPETESSSSTASVQALSVQRLSATSIVAQTASTETTELPSVDLVRQLVAPEVQVQAVGNPETSEEASPALRSYPLHLSDGLLAKFSPNSDFWQEIDAWDRHSGEWRKLAHLSELNHLVSAMAAFGGDGETEVTHLASHEHMLHPQLAASLV